MELLTYVERKQASTVNIGKHDSVYNKTITCSPKNGIRLKNEHTLAKFFFQTFGLSFFSS